METHNCSKNSNQFCYVCTKFVPPKNRVNIAPAIKLLYRKTFADEICDQNIAWVPHIICSACKVMLYRPEKNVQFVRPAIWSCPESEEDCYFCQNDTTGYNSLNKQAFPYRQVRSVILPVEKPIYSEQPGTSTAADNLENIDLQEEYVSSSSADNDQSDTDDGSPGVPGVSQRWNQQEVNDLVRELNLPKDGAEYLAVALKKRDI